MAMGAYLNPIAALGLELSLRDPRERKRRTRQPKTRLPPAIRLADYPQLQRLAWQLRGSTELTPQDALDLYERNWRHLDTTGMQANERELLSALVKEQGKGHLLV